MVHGFLFMRCGWPFQRFLYVVLRCGSRTSCERDRVRQSWSDEDRSRISADRLRRSLASMLLATSLAVLAFQPALHPAGLQPAVQPAVARSPVDISMGSPGLLKKLGLAKKRPIQIYATPSWNTLEQGGGSPPRTPPQNSKGRPERDDGPPLGPILSALVLGGAGSFAVRRFGVSLGLSFVEA